ncbi:hypothetical protein [Flavobacterium wongokense]|uniref:hypothetical protein n=1 Tax=Flavobacterium wongokense TaxID=2910674 RepID=UPI001F16CA96|nr:hypothetical protein [Flavobacterium sp. WG47]MCF6130748.1 hypothetical protein [Flavobacterium sp. WG47]
MKKRILISFILTVMLGMTSAYSQSQGCAGQFTTFTQGGYGTECHGGNPGCYRDAHFASAFPNGVVIGCVAGNTLTFTSSAAIAAYLPAGTGPAVLTSSAVNPTNTRGVLSSQILALTLSVGFDAADPNFSASNTSLGSLIIASGPFAGTSISAFLQIANNVLGGCSNAYTPSAINAVATALNENFDDGNTDNGYVSCNRDIVLNITVGANPNVCETGNGLVTITINGGTPGYELKIYKNNVLISVVNTNNAVAYLNNLGTGNFSVTCTDSLGNTGTGTWVIN